MDEMGKKVEIWVSGKPIAAAAGETVLHALWAAGMGGAVAAGCAGGVCGACVVSVRFADGRKGGTDLACLRPVEAGMEIFPCAIAAPPVAPPPTEPSLAALKAAFPALYRCTKCGCCTAACPMSIPVMESVLRMQRGEAVAAAEDYTSCIHCGLCRVVCEEKVLPHVMGMWQRRALGMARERPEPPAGGAPSAAAEWEYLLSGDAGERLRRARAFRKTGKMPC